MFYFCHRSPIADERAPNDGVPGGGGTRRIREAPGEPEARAAAPIIHRPSIKALARAAGLNHGDVAKLLRLALLALDLVEAVLDGRLPKGMRLQDLVRPLPVEWAEQRRVLLDGGKR